MIAWATPAPARSCAASSRRPRRPGQRDQRDEEEAADDRGAEQEDFDVEPNAQARQESGEAGRRDGSPGGESPEPFLLQRREFFSPVAPSSTVAAHASARSGMPYNVRSVGPRQVDVKVGPEKAAGFKEPGTRIDARRARHMF